jgi:hypothetical protein
LINTASVTFALRTMTNGATDRVFMRAEGGLLRTAEGASNPERETAAKAAVALPARRGFHVAL